MKSLDLMRLEGLREWQVVSERLAEEAASYNTFAADAPSMERKEYYRGMRDGLLKALLVPKEVLDESREEQAQDVEWGGPVI